METIANFLFLVLLATYANELTEIQNADLALREYLSNIMQGYSDWIEKHNFKFTHKLTIESLSSSEIFLHCELHNQQMTGLFSKNDQNIYTDSQLVGYSFAIERWTSQPYQFTGDFNCIGRINYPGLKNFSFDGYGNYQINTSTFDEIAGFSNVGITSDHKLNLTFSLFSYLLNLTFNSSLLLGRWSDTLVDKLNNEISLEFQDVYKRYLNCPRCYGTAQTHPSMQLIETYLRNQIENLDLKTIMNPEDLPSPNLQYVPAQTTVSPTSNYAHNSLNPSILRLSLLISFLLILF